MKRSVRRSRTRAALPLLAVSLLGSTGCAQMAQALAALAGTGTPTAATTPSVLGTPTSATPGATPKLLAPQANPSSPAAAMPPPAASAQEVARLNAQFGITIMGSCAQGTPLQLLEAGLKVFQDPKRFQGVTYDIPCETQDPGSSSGEWTGELTNGPYRIVFNGAPFQQLDRSLFIHETGHHLHLAHTNTDLRQKFESTVQTTPEWYPSAYSKPDPERGPPETVTKSDGTQMVMNLDQGEQIAELISYCKELQNGGIQKPLPDDTPNWSCPGTMGPVVQPL